MSEMSESRCFGAMVVGGVKMLLGSDEETTALLQRYNTDVIR